MNHILHLFSLSNHSSNVIPKDVINRRRRRRSGRGREDENKCGGCTGGKEECYPQLTSTDVCTHSCGLKRMLSKRYFSRRDPLGSSTRNSVSDRKPSSTSSVICSLDDCTPGKKHLNQSCTVEILQTLHINNLMME